jgi:dethiobiotin synthetase
MNGVFITGSDTEVGKTWVGCALIRGLVAQGIKVCPRKPIESGNIPPQDAEALRQAAGEREPLEDINRYAFEQAISPARAVRHAGIDLSLADLVDACQPQDDGFVMVEGAGGFLSPLAENISNADLAVALGLPVVVVVRYRLGCINQALLTIEAVERRQLTVQAVYLSERKLRSEEDWWDLCQLVDVPVQLVRRGEQVLTDLN